MQGMIITDDVVAKSIRSLPTQTLYELCNCWSLELMRLHEHKRKFLDHMASSLRQQIDQAIMRYIGQANTECTMESLSTKLGLVLRIGAADAERGDTPQNPDLEPNHEPSLGARLLDIKLQRS